MNVARDYSFSILRSAVLSLSAFSCVRSRKLMRQYKHVQSGYRLKVMFSNQFIVSEWTGENDAKTLRVVENFLENGEKKLRFQTNNATCGRGLRV